MDRSIHLLTGVVQRHFEREYDQQWSPSSSPSYRPPSVASDSSVSTMSPLPSVDGAVEERFEAEFNATMDNREMDSDMDVPSEDDFFVSPDALWNAQGYPYGDWGMSDADAAFLSLAAYGTAQ